MKDTQSDLRYGDPSTWTEEIWKALHAFREDLIPEGDEMYDDQWDEICTAMAWIEEDLKIEKEETITITWCVQDVLMKAKERNIKLTEAEGMEVLQATEDRHDANIGINWDVLQCHIDDLVQARERKAAEQK